MSDQEYEYYYEKRTRTLKVYQWNRERGSYWEDVENPEWTDWYDASGYNKQGSVYRKLSYIKANLTRSQQYNTFVEVEYRYFRRPVPPPLPWEPCDLEGNNVSATQG